MATFSTIVGFVCGIALFQLIGTAWVEQALSLFDQRLAVIGKIIVGIIEFVIGFAFGVWVAPFLLAYVVLRAVTSK